MHCWVCAGAVLMAGCDLLCLISEAGCVLFCFALFCTSAASYAPITQVDRGVLLNVYIGESCACACRSVFSSLQSVVFCFLYVLNQR